MSDCDVCQAENQYDCRAKSIGELIECLEQWVSDEEFPKAYDMPKCKGTIRQVIRKLRLTI